MLAFLGVRPHDAAVAYNFVSADRSQRFLLPPDMADVLAGNLCPDHVTIARFRSRHADALAEVFVDSLRLCAEAGLVRLGVVALDGTKIGSDASIDANRTLEELTKTVTEMLTEAEA